VIRVSASAFDILWTDLGHARPPAPLCVPSVGGTLEARADIRRAVYDNLAERGLYSGGRLDSELESRLGALARADTYVECEALVDMTAEEPFRAVAAVCGNQAVLATQPGQTVALSGIHAAEVFSAIVDVLPELSPGPGYGVSLPAAAMGGGVQDPVFDGPVSARSDSHDRQIREVLAIQARPIHGAGQFGVQVRDGGGKLRRAGGLSWFVTDVGAYFGTVTLGRNDQNWVNVAPADGPRLVARLAGILEQD
jgi:hypothetical protein